MVALHLLNELDGVLRARRNSGARLDIANDVEIEMSRKIRPRAMVRDDLAAGIGLHLFEPFLIGLLKMLLERRVALRKVGGVSRAHLAEFVPNPFGDAQAILRVEPIVRIALRVNITFGAGHLATGDL